MAKMVKPKAGGKEVVVGPVRLSFPNLFIPRAPEEGKTPKFSASLLIPANPAAEFLRLKLPETFVASFEERLKALKLSVLETAVEAWGGKDKLPREILEQDLRKGTAWPFRDQGEKEGDGYVPGGLFVNASSVKGVIIVDAQRRRILPSGDPLRDTLGRDGKLSSMTPDDIYPGCWVNVALRPFSYSNSGNEGISLGLGNVQFVCDDDKLGGGGGRVEDQFAPIGGTVGDDLSDLLK